MRFAVGLMMGAVLPWGAGFGCSGKTDKSRSESTGTTGATDATNSGTPAGPRLCPEFPLILPNDNPPECSEHEQLPLGTCEGDPVCVYDYCGFPFWGPSVEVSCVNGFWERTREEACDAPACPDIVVEAGAPCDAAQTPGPCQVLNPCEDSVPVYCKNGVWELECTEAVAEPELFPSCPTYPPNVGDACCPRWRPPECDYSAFVDTGTVSGVAASTATGGMGSGGPIWTPTGPVTPCMTCNANMVWEACN